MAEIGSAFVSIIPSARGFGTSLQRQAGPQISRSGALMGAGLGRSLLKGFIAIGVITQITGFVKDAFDEAREAQKVGALTANVIKTTGGVANVTAIQVNRLADALSRKTGIDDEQIASSENMLLTFKNVRRAGEGLQNIFGRAARAAVDLSASGFGDLIGTSKQLGKALNDPLKGLTALGRAGVTFTAQQVDQIKALVASGKTFKAQQVILAEVESQVKGAAEAQATAGDKARVSMANLKEQIGTALIPAADGLANLFTNKIAPAISTFVTNLQSGKGSAGALGNFIRDDLLPVLRQFGDYLITKVVPAIQAEVIPAIDRGRKAFNQIRDAVRENKPQLTQLFNAFKKIADFILTKFIPMQIKMASVVFPIVSAGIRTLIAAATFWVNAFNGVRNAIDRVQVKLLKLVVSAKTTATNIVQAFRNLPTILRAKGLQIVAGLARGLMAGAGLIVAATEYLSSLIPDKIGKILQTRSPSKVTYKLGEMAGQGLANGIAAKTKEVGKKTKELVDKVKEQLSGLRSDFASLVDPIASAFTDSLFDATTASEFVSNLLGTKGTLQNLSAAFTKLIKQGLNPKFLYGLFQSGNAGLILDLAANPELAAQAGGLFGDVNQLSNQLGQEVAGATPEGKAVLGKMDRLERKLDHLIDATKKVGGDVGREVNGAASSGRRRAA